jgi:endonuclease III
VEHRRLKKIGWKVAYRAYHDGSMAVTSMSSREIGGGDAGLRVLREPVRSYTDLEPLAAREHREWQKRTRERLESARGSAVDLLGDALSVLEAELFRLVAMLAQTYGTPDLGNKVDPVDELVYIILSRRTREEAYQAAFNALKQRYRSWEDLAVAPAGEIEEAIRFSGLARRKAQSLKLALVSLIDQFGECTLEPTRGWDDEATLQFLCTLPEVGPKSAACVMMCSLDRPAFPVDAHVGRVLERLGLFRAVGIELAGSDHKAKQRLLWDAVPPALRYSMHVNLLVHGRRICLPGRPRCDDCVLSWHCDYAVERRSDAGTV